MSRGWIVIKSVFPPLSQKSAYTLAHPSLVWFLILRDLSIGSPEKAAQNSSLRNLRMAG